jgi:hypothetical protein
LGRFTLIKYLTKIHGNMFGFFFSKVNICSVWNLESNSWRVGTFENIYRHKILRKKFEILKKVRRLNGSAAHGFRKEGRKP